MAARLEGFGDIVFGFAVAQCALALPTVSGHIDLTNPFGILVYLGTFAVLARLWLTFHRLISGTFRPAGFDLFISFAFLALVSLVPFAMYALSHATGDDVRLAFAEYAAVFAGLMLISGTLALGNLRRGWFVIDAAERASLWHSALVRFAGCTAAVAAFAFDLAYGVGVGTVALAIAVGASRLALVRISKEPSQRLLRIAHSASEVS